MRTIIFTIYDEKAEVFLPPFFVPTIGIATRAFKDCINSTEHQFSKHPGDYTLFQLGEFFDHDCSFDIPDKKMLGNGVEFLDPDHIHSIEERPDALKPPIQSDKNSGDPT